MVARRVRVTLTRALGLRRGGVGPAAQAAGPAQLAQHGLAFGVGLLGPLDVPGPVGRVQLGVQGGQAAAVGGAGGPVQRRPGPGGGQAGAAGGQVQGGDVASGRGQQGAQVVQAAAVPQPGPLGAGLQQPVVTIPAQGPLVGRAGQPLQQHRHPQPLRDQVGPAPLIGRRPGVARVAAGL
jgi:hypothetical protein